MANTGVRQSAGPASVTLPEMKAAAASASATSSATMSAGAAPTRADQPKSATAARILAIRGMEATIRSRIARAQPVGFDYPVIQRGSTAHFNVYYEQNFANGPAICDAVIANCENDYNYCVGVFGGITPPGLPMNVIVAPGLGGAYHYGCSGVDLYCDGDTSANPDVNHTLMLVVAEEVEVFQAASGLGWNCGASPGEGLSRVLATERYPSELNGFASAASWLDTPDRPDWVSNSDPTDLNYVSIGCSTLFLNYLRYQLDFTWPEIVAAGGATLETTYEGLKMAPAGAITPFKNLLQSYYPVGQPSGLTNDNPFPLPATIPVPFSGVQWRATIPANSSQLWFTYGWPNRWDVVWNVIPNNINSGGAEIGVSVQVEKTPDASLTYWLTVTNPSSTAVDFEGRYTVVGA